MKRNRVVATSSCVSQEGLQTQEKAAKMAPELEVCDHKTMLLHQLVVRMRPLGRDYRVARTALKLVLISFVVILTLFHHRLSSLAIQVPDLDEKIRVRIGVLLEESDHEQANMFIRTIKMINEQGDETIRQLLSLSSSARRQPAVTPATTSKRTRRKKSLAPRANERSVTAFSNRTESAHITPLNSERDHWFGQDKMNRAFASKDSTTGQIVGQKHLMEEGPRRRRQQQQQHPEHEYSDASAGSNNNEIDPVMMMMPTVEKPINNDKLSELAQGPNGDDARENNHATYTVVKVRLHRSSGNELASQYMKGSFSVDDEETKTAADESSDGNELPEQSAFTRGPTKIKLEPMIEFLSDGQSALEADGKVCQLIESGVHAIVGPIDGNSIQHVQSICDNLEIPYFELRPFVGGTLVAPIPIPISSPKGLGGETLAGGESAPSTFLPPTSFAAAAAATPSSIVDSSKIQLPTKGEQPTATPVNKQRRQKHNTNNNHQLVVALDSVSDSAETVRKSQSVGKKKLKRKNNSRSIGRQEQRFTVQSAQSQPLVKRGPKVSPLDNDIDQSGANDLVAMFQLNRSGTDNHAELVIREQQQSLELRRGQNHHGDKKLSNLSVKPDQLSSNDKQLNEENEGVEVDDNEEEDGEEGDDVDDEVSAGNSSASLPSTPLGAAAEFSKGTKSLLDSAYRDSLKFKSSSDEELENYSPASNPSSSDDNSNHRHHFRSFQPTESVNNKLEDLTMNLYPPSHLLSSAYIDMIYALNWTSFAIVYEEGTSMIRLQDLLRESSSGTWSSHWKIRLFRYDSNSLDPDNAHDTKGTSSSNYDTQEKNVAKNYDNIHRGEEQRSKMFGGNSSSTPPPKSPPIASALNSKLQHPNLGSWSETDYANRSLNFSQLSSGNNPIFEHVDTRLMNIQDHGSATSSDSTRTSRTLNYNEWNLDDFISDHQQDLLLQQDAPSGIKFHSSKKYTPVGKQQSDRGTFRDVFWRIKLTGEQNILLDVKTENLFDALKQAQQVGCMTENYSYLITSLDLHTIDLEDFKYSRTKITGFSLIQVAKDQQSILRKANGSAHEVKSKSNTTSRNRPMFDEKYLENLGIFHLIQQNQRSNEFSQTSKDDTDVTSKSSTSFSSSKSSDNLNKKSPNSVKWTNQLESEAANNDQTRRELLQSSPASLSLLPTVNRNNEQRLFDLFLQLQERDLSRTRLSTSSAILHDSLILYTMGLQELDPSGNFLGNLQAITCSLESQPWSHGSSMVNYMRQSSFSGLTGMISFDQRGLRTNFKLDVMGMAPNLRLVKVGEWHSSKAVDRQKRRPSTTEAQEGASTVDKASETETENNLDSENKSYEELSSRYELEFKRYTRLLASGEKIDVPYTKRVSPNGALVVNDIIFDRLYHDQADQVDTLIVTAKLSQPYFMLKETPNKLDGNDQFEGYAVDLIHELSKLVNFKYKWREVADKKYGSKEVLPNGTVVWNGMIGEIVRGVADLAIVDLTITAQREEAVDFTLPFMNTGISILFKKPTTKVTTLFSFLSPFSSDVWAYVLAAYCGISAILFLVGHLSPYEWADPHPCRHITKDDDAKVLKNQFSLLNSFWFTIGSLMQQGSDLTPRSMSTRTIAGIWYFFTLIMISSYTANLAAFLTVEKVVYPIENVRDLSNQQEIKYGCVESGSTCLFFHDSQIDTYKKINENMRGFKTNVRSNDEGQKRVGEGKFAFFMESTTIEYIIERNCNLTQIGGLIDSKGYGLATSKRPRYKRPYRTLLNEGILHLQETGMLHVLKNRWWKERRGGGTCTDDGKGGGVTELSLANVGGVFVVLLGGLGISFLVAIAEFMWRARRGGSSRDRMCEEMMNDLKFALACKSSTKPNKRNLARLSQRNKVAMLSQQDSMLSQYQFDDVLDPTLMLEYQRANGGEDIAVGLQRQQSHFSTKECDPILLHAMLTMLMEQQRVAPSSMTPYQGLIDVDRQQQQQHQRQQQPKMSPNNLMAQHMNLNGRVSDHLDANQQAYGSSTSFIDGRLAGGAPGMVRNHNHQQKQQRHQQHQQLYNNWSQANHAASGRRRTLQSQQTIDLPDDNLSNVPINHFTETRRE